MHSLIVKYGGVSLSINLYLKLAPVPYATPKRPITNDFLYPSDSKIYDRVPQYNEPSLLRTDFSSRPLSLRYIEVPL